DIDISFLTVGELPTGVATILVEENGANRIVIVPGANFELAPEIAEQGILSLRPSVVVGQLEISTQATIAAFKAGKEIGATTVLNPAPATDDSALPSELLELTDWLIPNENEFHALANEEVSEDAVRSFARKHKIKLVVTVGEEGAILADAEGEIIRFTAPTVTAVDTTGAGDAFVGAFAHGLSTGLNPKDAISLAIDQASDSVTRKGTQISYSSDGA
ncbi:MAG: PfkB family carbohydrate kinase, partial [Actinomycetota bacterium]|nr:PfkB family carbohydrate kinase [Actinomycetota bacterium]